MLRGIAILGVILIHISAESLNSPQTKGGVMEILFIILNQLSRFAVPVFLFLSGFAITMTKKLDEGYLTFLRKRLSIILPLYVLWTVVYYLISVNGQIIIFRLFKSIFLGSAFYHLYFVPLIVCFYVLYPLFKKVSKNNAAMILILVITISSQLTDELLGIEIVKDHRNFLNWCIYFVLGIRLSNHYEQIKQKLRLYPKVLSTVLTIVAIGIVCETFLYLQQNISLGDATTSMRPSIILYTVTFIGYILIIKWRNRVVSYVLEELSKLSYGIYLSHALVLFVWSAFFTKIGLQKDTALFGVTSFFFVLLFSVILTKLNDLVLIKKLTRITHNSEKKHS